MGFGLPHRYELGLGGARLSLPLLEPSLRLLPLPERNVRVPFLLLHDCIVNPAENVQTMQPHREITEVVVDDTRDDVRGVAR